MAIMYKPDETQNGMNRPYQSDKKIIIKQNTNNRNVHIKKCNYKNINIQIPMPIKSTEHESTNNL